jgi:hypothetical protein
LINIIKKNKNKNKNIVFDSYLASSVKAKTPAASGAAAEVPECLSVHFPYKSVVATPASGSEERPLLKVDASVDEHDSSYKAVRPSFIAEFIEIVHILAA